MPRLTADIQDFKELITEGMLYIDKTKKILDIVNDRKNYLLVRPRRFGKSLTLSTIKYLYLGEKELFSGLYVEDKWDWQNYNPIIQLSFAGWSNNYETVNELINFIFENVKIYVKDEYSNIVEMNVNEVLDIYQHNFSKLNRDLNSITDLINIVYALTGKKVVILIDEYDKPVLANIHKKNVMENFRNFFSGFYAGIKDIDPKIKLFMLSGLTKILKMSIFSVLNNITDLSYNPLYYDLVGYTENDLKKYFINDIRNIAHKYNTTEEDMFNRIKKFYNGFNFGNIDNTIYNPWDINNLILNQQIGYYWATTGLPSSIDNYIKAEPKILYDFITTLNERGGYIIDIASLVLEDIDSVNPATLLLASGYLTIKEDYGNAYLVNFPNIQAEEIVLNFILKKIGCVGDIGNIFLNASMKFRQGIINENPEQITEAINMALKFNKYVTHKWFDNNPEGWFKTLLYYLIVLNTKDYIFGRGEYFIGEKSTMYGDNDIVLQFNDKIYIIEAKVGSKKKELDRQINDYAKNVSADAFIGILWKKNNKQEKVETFIKYFPKQPTLF